ncbi:SRPBCC family protein [Roseicyclus sp. F158]|uniref:SRPBCC family protein n=1 Tax=Tropicimonas omnivorans TaxID=3075590 RepID=A0ABU3DKN1_9RHOB|nr:SRPBCC family protein [Roseicyclus sp. F158]MDT0684148.1 SRPBCC family protein [Roseicyclus sp. F158]
MFRNYRSDDRRDHDPSTLWIATGIGALLGVAAFSIYQAQTRNSVAYRPDDDAPLRVSRRQDSRLTVTGRTVTIDRPRSELYAFWRDFSNLPQVMENVRDVTGGADLSEWTIEGPAGRDVTLVTTVTEDLEGERIAWESTYESEIEHHGYVAFRDAPAGRGTEVTLELAYAAPGGTLGRWVAKALQAEPHLQARRDLKRLKMLMETGEIATNSNRRDAA